MASTISTCSCGTSAQRRLPSGCSKISTSETPRIFAASCSSLARTLPRSAFATSAGSLTAPFSPREAQIRMTRAPASERRAMVPPHASDSSSGCAKTTRMVRPEKSGAPDDAFKDRDVPVDHPLDAEPRDRAVSHPPAVESEDRFQAGSHLVERVEGHARDALVDDFAHGAEIERDDGRAARHRFGEHETEGLASLHGIEECPGAAEQLHLSVEVGLAVINNL